METKKDEKKKKGLFGTIWESMNKTGGCCGSGESCCSPEEEQGEKKNNENSDKE